MEKIDITGKRFGSLVAVSCFNKINNSNRSGIMWICKCDCGKTTISTVSKLRKGIRFSCGCSRRKELGAAALNKLYNTYKSGATKRNLKFELNLKKFKNITSENCHYCGSSPCLKIDNNDNRIGKFGQPYKFYGNYVYNGIDRLDNTKGYTLDNCVPCCKICNRAKSNLSIEEFNQWIKKLCQNQKTIL